MVVQDVLRTLNDFWAEKGCVLWQPYHTEVGAGTSNPATFLRVLGPEPWWVAYPEPSIRPADGRYGENPNRLQHYYQYQVILKPSPPDVQELFLQSLEALGLDLTQHDFRFVEDNWQSPSLGAWGLGWEAWLDGMEILQFTYFQECGGLKLNVRACELTYGIERICMYLQGVESVYDLKWNDAGLTYGDIFHAQEVEFCKYNFEAADIDKLLKTFDMWEAEANRLLEEGLILPAYDHCLRLSHLFNLLDARGALSVLERGSRLLRCRRIAEGCAKGFHAQREEMGFPLMRYGRPGHVEHPSLIQLDPAALNEKDTLLLEIGVEELPHGDLKDAVEQAPKLAAKLFKDCGMDHGAITVHATPRRIALLVEDVPARQEDVVTEVKGPKKEAAVGDDGDWTLAAQKFAESKGVTTQDIYFQQAGKFEHCFVKFYQEGKHIGELLDGFVDGFIGGLQFRKSMGWEDGSKTFSRPVRWLLALHGDTPLPVQWRFAEKTEFNPERVLHSGIVTYGHRRLGGGTVEVPSASAYLDTLRAQYVLPDREERMGALRQAVDRVCTPLNLETGNDTELFDEICDLVEWPEPVLGEIPAEALELPEEIVITPMKLYQRYIPLRTGDGKLSRYFIAVANGDHGEDGREVIRLGNERVLNARLRDAKYFWDTDIKTPLAEFAKGLSKVLFHKKLGTVAEKIERLRALNGRLKEALPKVKPAAIEETLDLMKADLTTQMVFEFDSLQGVVGMLYARAQGIEDNVATAIYEHWLPRRAGDALPQTGLGIVAGLLDRFDTLAGYFGIGIRVKGTSDPFGLRRNALAVLAIAQSAGLDLDLEHCLRAAMDVYGDVLTGENALDDLLAFFRDRLEVMARDQGHPHDYVAAALQAHGARPRNFWLCVDALRDLGQSQVQDLAEQAKRMQRIAKEPASKVDPKLLAAEEKPLAALRGEPAARLSKALKQANFDAAMAELANWVPVIDTYFEKVLVNDKNDAVRQNRHGLVLDVLATMQSAADFTQVEKK